MLVSFLDHISSESRFRNQLDFLDFKKLSNLEVEFLEADPTLEEVKNVVLACGTNKTTSYDGFNFKFFRELWEEVKVDVFNFISEFLHTGFLSSMVNVSWVALILKVK